jgi:sugar phosphate isomerase/epimerase
MTPATPLIAVLARSLSGELRRAADDARTLGFDGLTLEPSQLDESARSQSGRREVAHIVASRGLKLVAVKLELPPRALLESALADRALGETQRTIELTAGLRAGVVSLDLGSLPDVAAQPTPPQKPASLDAGLLILPSAEETSRFGGAARATTRPSSSPGDFSLVRAFIDELARFADRFGVKLALGSSLSSLASLHHAMRDITLPLVGLDLDPPTLLSDSWTLDDAFEKFPGRVLYVRGRDAIGGAGGRSRSAIVGEGDVRWDEVLAAVRDADCSASITLEPGELSNPRAGAIAGLRYLRSLLA